MREYTDLVTSPPIDVDDEADTAGVLLQARVVETLCSRPPPAITSVRHLVVVVAVAVAVAVVVAVSAS